MFGPDLAVLTTLVVPCLAALAAAPTARAASATETIAHSLGSVLRSRGEIRDIAESNMVLPPHSLAI
jgi:hypothetical protein